MTNKKLLKLFLLVTVGANVISSDICTLKPTKNTKNKSLPVVYSLNNVTQINYIQNNTFPENDGTFDVLKTWAVYSNPLVYKLQNVSSDCLNGFKRLENSLKNLELWAIKMVDASAKLQSGILSGNINQYGQFDQCLEVDSAQYCLAELDFTKHWNHNINHIKDLAHSYYPIKGKFQDPAHRVPSFSIIKWGLCLPKQCTNQDIENILKDTLNTEVYMRPNLCQTAKKLEKKSFGDVFTAVFFIILALVILVSTILSYYGIGQHNNENRAMQMLRSFSLVENWKSMTTLNDNGLKAVDGWRGLSALGLIVSHKFMALLYNPYINRTYMAKTMTMGWSVLGRTAILYTDAFMLISALLSAKSIFKDLETKNTMNFKDKLINRICRISPNLITVILFCTYILPNMGSGPLWPIVVDHHAHLCKENMWRNFFYIHNYFGFENMCLTHSHQVAIDMQLFLTLPIFTYIIWKFKKSGIIATIIVAMLSTILRFVVTYYSGISHLIYYGISISTMFNTANLSYILPTHRATIYIFGILLALILHHKYEFPKSKLQEVFVWSVALIPAFAFLLGPVHAGNPKYEHNRLESAIFGAFSPIFAGIGICWVIYASNMGRAGWLSDFLSWKGFKLFSKISYSVYLTQFPVFFYNVGVRRYAEQYTPFLMLQISETLVIILVSTLLTLCVEMPFMNISKILLAKTVNSNNKKVK